MAWRPDYITVAELKEYVRVDDSVDDVQLAWAVSSASRAVDRHCNRQFGMVAAPQQRQYPARFDRSGRRWYAHIDDLQTTTGMTIDSALTVTWAMEPYNAVADGMAWTGMAFTSSPFTDGELRITASWGWAVVPTAVKLATAMQAARFAARRQSPFGVAGSPDMGNELRLLAKVDPDVAVTLALYTRSWYAR